MLSKISNTATKKNIEETLNAVFDYEYLYQPRAMINGKKESSVCIVTAEAPHRIQFGIWGILPSTYMGSWKKFQAVHSTLEVSCESVPESSWLFEPLLKRRCLIIATGFYSDEITDHGLKSVKTSLTNNAVFCFAGIYNVLEDGFITCSILNRSTNTSLHQLEKAQPIIIPPEHYSEFLREGTLQDGTCVTSLQMDPAGLEQKVLNKGFLHLV